MPQTLKGDLATNAARCGGDWDQGLEKAEDAYNNRFHSAVHGALADVETNPRQQSRVLQDNAEKYEYNRSLQIRRETDLKEAGAFRAPSTTAGTASTRATGPSSSWVGSRGEGST